MRLIWYIDSISQMITKNIDYIQNIDRIFSVEQHQCKPKLRDEQLLTNKDYFLEVHSPKACLHSQLWSNYS